MTARLTLPELGLLTLREPKAASEIILRWNLSKEAIWTSIGLVSVLATILSTLSNMLFPVPAPLGVLAANPFIYFLITAGGFVLMAQAVFWTGRMMGGQGRIEDLMVLLVWLQAMRIAAQAMVMVLLLIMPALASMFVIFVMLASLWVFVHFINAALRLESLGRAVLVLFVAALIVIASATLILSILGVSTVGVPV